ncbi:sulfotransferase family domain-containing protein [Ditylenchus destructor]|uniref:Sulfotransferase family domain-containing protein n=1 Tax=Ditylenchus destructor TaxID=166010 RepID=A0AAD4QXH2_9BILA|nr:sulfotransferase family domain-containing protein [Ditylenchus destructor]
MTPIDGRKSTDFDNMIAAGEELHKDDVVRIVTDLRESEEDEGADVQRKQIIPMESYFGMTYSQKNICNNNDSSANLCVPKFGPWSSNSFAMAPKSKTIACRIQKVMSTVLDHIACYLSDEKAFHDGYKNFSTNDRRPSTANMVWLWNGFLYGLSQVNLGVYGLSQVNLGVYGLSQYTGYPSIRAIPVYGLSQVNLGVYGLSQYTGYPSIRAIPVYRLSQYTGYPSIRAIPVYGPSQYTGYPSIRAIPVYGLSQVNLGVYGLSQVYRALSESLAAFGRSKRAKLDLVRDLSQNINSLEHLFQHWNVFAVIRHPIDRLLSGFLDKCISHPIYLDTGVEEDKFTCHGCGANFTCFVINQYHRIMAQSQQPEYRITNADIHFFPQSW